MSERELEIRWVEWIDSARAVNDWIDAEAEMDTVVCYSVGFVRSETDDALILAGDLNEEQHGRVHAIPKVAILKSRTLRKGKQP